MQDSKNNLGSILFVWSKQNIIETYNELNVANFIR